MYERLTVHPAGGPPSLPGKRTQLHRVRFEIYYEILSLCQKPTKRTHVMFRANLSYSQLAMFLSELTKMGLLSLTDQGYVTTDRGGHFMVLFEELLRTMLFKEITAAPPSPLPCVGRQIGP